MVSVDPVPALRNLKQFRKEDLVHPERPEQIEWEEDYDYEETSTWSMIRLFVPNKRVVLANGSLL
jgi:hypothetical protein